MSAGDTTIAWRVGRVEERQNSIDHAAAAQGVTLAVHEEQITEHEKQIATLASTVNKAIWALVGFSLTVASSAVIIAFTAGSQQ